ncbi:MAG: sulfotransferase [Pseudomonadota bacterium]
MSDPAPPDAFAALVATFQSGHVDAAHTGAERLLQDHPEDSRLWNLFAAIETQRGQMDAALDAFGKSLSLDPNNARALNNRAGLFQRLDRLEDAIADATAGLRLLPNDPELLNTLAGAQILQGNLAEAEANLRTCLHAQPDYVEALVNLGVVLSGRGDPKGGVDHLQRALALRPSYDRARTNLGNALIDCGRHQEAIKVLQAVPPASPDVGTAARNLARAYEELGDLDRAADHAQSAINAAPDTVAAYLQLARMGRLAIGDQNVTRMEALAADPTLGRGERQDLLFALARAYDRAPGTEERAMGILSQANRLCRDGVHWDPHASFALHRHVQRIDRVGPLGPPLHPIPVFIVGMPRSGSTLIEQVLSSHAQVDGGGEHAALEHALSDLASKGAIDASALAAAYHALRPVAAAGTTHQTDKNLFNFRYIGPIADAFPDAPIIHTRRHPMAVCWSIYQNKFSDGTMPFGYDLADIGAYYRRYLDVMAHWDRALPGRCYTLDYRALTENQEAETRRLLDHLGLPFDPACLAFQDNDRVVATASSVQVRQKMFKGSSEAWRRYETHLEPLKRALGDALDGWD